MRRLLLITLFIPTIVLAESSKTYLQSSVIFWTRNFEEATSSNTNDDIESLEGGFSFGIGHRFTNSFALELEFLPSMGFEVSHNGQTGEISMYAITIAPVYIFKPNFLNEKMEFFAKYRIGYTKMKGTDILGNNGQEDSITMGMAFGSTYKFNDRWSGYIDIGGLWSDGDIENFDFHPWQVGIRFSF